MLMHVGQSGLESSQVSLVRALTQFILNLGVIDINQEKKKKEKKREIEHNHKLISCPITNWVRMEQDE